MFLVLRRLLALTLFLALSHTTYAFNFNPANHLRVYYDFCEEDIVVEFVYFQSAGDNDRMDQLFFKHSPASGQPVTIIDFRHSDKFNGQPFTVLGPGSPTNSFGYNLSSSNGHNWQIIRQALWEEVDQEGHKYWVRFILRDLPASTSETFTIAGSWNGQGSSSPDLDINMTYPMNLYVPKTPSNFKASQGQCKKIELTWNFDDFDSDCVGGGWTYIFRLYRNESNTPFKTITADPAVSSYSTSDPRIPDTTAIQSTSYRIRVVTRKNGSDYQLSDFAGPVTGNPLPLPLPPTVPEVEYPDCLGAVKLSWQNSQIYDSIVVRLVPNMGPTLRDTILGSSMSHTMTIDSGKTYVATIIGLDACQQAGISESLAGVAIPGKPKAFALQSATAENGAMRLTWSSSPGADSYTVIRQPDNVMFEVGEETTYLDVDAKVCTAYSYKIKATNTCGFRMSNTLSAPILPEDLDVWSDQRLSASKGYFGNRVELSWDAPDVYGFDHFKIYRRPLGSQSAFEYKGQANKNELQFVDEFTQAGTLYEYSLRAVSDCNGSNNESTALTDVGFRLPVAIINGNIRFESGAGVEDVQVSVERNGGALGKSLHFAPNGTMTVHPGYAAAPQAEFDVQPGMTIECWIRPDNLGQDFHVFRYENGSRSYGLRYVAGTGSLVQYFANGANGTSITYPVSLSTAIFTHLSWVRGQGGLALYLDGEALSGTQAAFSSPGGSVPLTFAGGYAGYLDEIRYWTRQRSLAEIQGDYTSILRGDEPFLAAYWRIDEGVGDGVYDISGVEDMYHARHLQVTPGNGAIWTNEFPAGYQLGNRSFTDSVGNYSVRNIRYSGTGSLFTVIPFFSPQGTPHEFEPGSTVLYLGEGNNVENGINFLDKSSFRISGLVRYLLGDTLCTNSTAMLYVDDRLAQLNGQPVKINNGIFEVDVPIGLHRINIRQEGHVFQDKGAFPPDGGLFDFQKDLSIEFFDSTRVRVIGRVVGGTREGDKKLGFGKSRNNIGIADMLFASQQFGCHDVDVMTDSLTGEYAVDLLPFKYDVSIDMRHNPYVDFGVLDGLDLSIVQEDQYVIDTVFSPAGQPLSSDSVRYNVAQSYIHRVVPEVSVVQAADSLPLRGDSLFVYVRPQSMDTFLIPLVGLPYPAFMAGAPYATRISAFELYNNIDNPSMPLEDPVPVLDGRITIRNGLGNALGTGQEFDEIIDLADTDGDTVYTFVGGQPEFVMDGSQSAEFSFTKTFDVLLETPTGVSAWRPNGELFRGYVLGSKPVEGSSFVTEGPELVDFVLRDPPGDASFTEITQGTSFSTSRSWFVNLGATAEISAKIKLGTKTISGTGFGAFLGFETENSVGIETGVKVGISGNREGNLTETITFEQAIQTSELPYFTGAPMDLYIGKATNYLFGKADELSFIETSQCGLADLCIGPEIPAGNTSFRLAKRRGLFMVPQGFSTTFAYSQFHIEGYLIPNLEGLRNDLFVQFPNLYQSNVDPEDPGFGLNNDDPYWSEDNDPATMPSSADPILTEPADETGPSYTFTPPPGNTEQDRVRWYNQQIRLWREAMAENEREKIASATYENISFDAGTTLSRTITRTKEDTDIRKFELATEFNVGTYIESNTGGTGSSAKFVFGVQVAGGTGSEDIEGSSESYKFQLADGQPGDFFSVDVKRSPTGHGPIFSLRGGQSMCPWEQGDVTHYYEPGTQLSVPTIRRELPELDVTPSFQANVPDHQPARFQLKMRNASPTGEIQWYGLRLIEQSNPFGATLKIDGFSPNRIFEVPAGETIEKTLEVYKADSNHYELKFMLYSTCEYEGFQNGANIYATDTVTLSAHFVPSCGPVSVRQPTDLWVHNVDDGQAVEVQLRDYRLQDANLSNIQLQYKPAYTSVWKGVETFWKTPPPGEDGPEIPPGSALFTYLWNIDELPDGPYDLRAVTHCTNTDNDYACPKVTGIVDRIRPHAFGNPQPADGVLDPNDEILIRFNEPINPASVSVVDFDVRAVLNGAPLRNETSVLLDGINDYVDIPAGMRLGQPPFSFEIWLRRLGTGAQLLWSQGEDQDSSMAIGFNGTNRLYFRWYDQTILSDAVITANNNWYHVAVTVSENGIVTFFVTGTAAGAGSIQNPCPIPGNMQIGGPAWGGGTGRFHGYLHQARIWRSELTIGMIQTQLLKRLSGAEPGLSALWPMDEGMGTSIREVVRKRNAILFGDWAVLPSGQSIRLDGNDALNVSAGTMAFSKQHDFTLEWWLKGSVTGNVQTLVSNGRGDGTDGNEAGWSIQLTPAGQLQVQHGGQTFSLIQRNILDDDWHHVALVLNRQGNLNTYLDGGLQTSLYGDAFGEFGGGFLWIGNRGWYELSSGVEMHDQFYHGLIDEFRVWNTRLTAEMIRASINSRLAGDEFGLQLYLPFESYQNVGGAPVLLPDLTDQSPLQRMLTQAGSPQFEEEDPNIKLTPPFEKVNFAWSINGDEILITPTMDPLRIEKTLLHISIRNVQDLHGNSLAGPITWTAFVNKNQLQWADDELFFEKPEKETMSFTADIVNSGGIELSYEILGLPDWLTCMQPVGTISPLSTKTLHFVIDGDVNIGDYSTDINLLSGQGYNDKLALDLHVFGVPPAWSFDPHAYPHSMTIVADLDIRGELSEDPLDRVAAYINGEVRGLATPEYIPELDRYLVFLEVYSNVLSGENVTFKVWDAGTGTTYAGVNIRVGTQTNLQIPYLANSLVGNAVTPARFVVTNDIIQEIPLNAGWTWISFNVLSPKFNNLDLFFQELNFENNDAIYSQTKNAVYNPSSGWQGNLKNDGLEIRKMYKCDFTYADILRVVGPRVNPDLYPITIAKGWNWIPYLSAERIELNEALSSFTATAGDIVKSQNQVAVYHPTQGWVGTLTSMEPGKGYMLFADKVGTIIFPLAARGDIPFSYTEAVHEQAIQWRNGGLPNPIEGQERNMTVIARLESEVSISGKPWIAAMADGVLLDLLPGHRIDGTDDLYYFTLQASGPDRMVYFEVYDAGGQYAGLVDEKLYWSADQHLGSIEDPFVLHLRAEGGPALEAYPNPFSETLYLEYEATQTGPVSIRLYDTAGRLVHTANETVIRPGLQKWTLSGHGTDGKPFVTGSYIVEIVQGETLIRRQLVRT